MGQITGIVTHVSRPRTTSDDIRTSKEKEGRTRIGHACTRDTVVLQHFNHSPSLSLSLSPYKHPLLRITASLIPKLHAPSPPLYKTIQTATPAKSAIPALARFATAPPLNGAGDAVPEPLGVVDPVGVLVLLEALPLVRVKLAHVRRVALAEWMTRERLPKKEAGPEAVER